jgi:hypothetical protein
MNMLGGAHKNNNNNNTTPMLMGLNKTTQNSGPLKRKINAGKDKEICSQRNVFYCERRNCNSIEIFSHKN